MAVPRLMIENSWLFTVSPQSLVTPVAVAKIRGFPMGWQRQIALRIAQGDTAALGELYDRLADRCTG